MGNQDKSKRRDLSLARSQRWRLTESQRNVMIDRLLGIINKQSVAVAAKKEESKESEDAADKNAIAACRVLVDLESQNQQDEVHADQIESGSATSIELHRPIVLMLPANSRGEMPR